MQRWFQFKLRTLLVAFIVLALPLSWAAYNANLVRQRRALRQMLDQGDGSTREIAVVVNGTVPLEVPWIRRVFGDFPAAGFWWDNKNDGGDRMTLERMHRLFPEATIMEWNSAGGGDVVEEADMTLRRKGAASGPHPRYLQQGR